MTLTVYTRLNHNVKTLRDCRTLLLRYNSESCYLTVMEFRDWLAEQGVTQNAAAEMIGCTQPYVTMLAAGQRQPSLTILRRIVQMTDGQVGFEDFVDVE